MFSVIGDVTSLDVQIISQQSKGDISTKSNIYSHAFHMQLETVI